MADSDKDILITPNTGAATDPSIVFSSGATGGDDVTLFVTDDGTITTLSIEGSAGQLFSVSNDLTGIIFSVNDISGIPSLEVNADGTVSIAEFDGDVGIGTSSPSAQLHVIADSATTNADIPVIRITSTSTGTPATGIGPSIEFESETAAGSPGNLEIGGVLALESTDVTATTEDFDFVFSTMAAGAAAAERMRITSTGNVTATSFGGITEANLVDKTAAETITGAWDFNAGATVLNGLDFGSVVGASATDLTEHIALWGSTYGFNVTSNTLNVTAAGTNTLSSTSSLITSRVAHDFDGNVTGSGSNTLSGFLSIEGITSANLVDKTATETISGSWNYTAVPTVSGGKVVYDQGTLDGADFDLIDATNEEGIYTWTTTATNSPFNYGTLLAFHDSGQINQLAFGGAGFGQMSIRRRDSGTWYAWSDFVSVDQSHTPVNNRVATWVSATELDSSANLTFDGSTLNVTGTVAATTVTGANVTSGADPGHTHGAGSVPNHDSLNGFVADEHIDWTVDSGSQIQVDNLAVDRSYTGVSTVTPQYSYVGYDRFSGGVDNDELLDAGIFGLASGDTNGAGNGTFNPMLVMRNSSDVRVQVSFPRENSNPIAYRGYHTSAFQSWHYTGWTTTEANANLDATFAKISGTPANNQIAVWTGATDIEGTSGLTYDGSSFAAYGDGTATDLHYLGVDTNDRFRFECGTNYGMILYEDNNVSTENSFFYIGNDTVSTGRQSIYFRKGGSDWAQFDNFGSSSRFEFTGPLEIAGTTDHVGDTGLGTNVSSDRIQIWAKSRSLDHEPMITTGDQDLDYTFTNVNVMSYHHDQTITSADPGAGNIRWNSLTPASVTNLYIDDLESTGRDASFMLANLADGDILTIRATWDAADYLVCSVNGTPTDNTGWWTVPVTIIHSGAGAPTTGDPIHIGVEWMSQAPGGGGITGTVANNQVVTGTGASTVDSSANLTFDGTNLTMPTAATGIRLESTTDVSLASTTHPFQIGLTTSTNIAIDGNEIMARNNGAASDLYLNNEGGIVRIGSATAGSLYVDNGSTLRVYDGAGTDYLQIVHDGTDILYTSVNSGYHEFDNQVKIDSAAPKLAWVENDATANNGWWDMVAATEQFLFRVRGDGDVGGTNIFTVDRTGTTVDSFDIAADTSITGTLTFNDATAAINCSSDYLVINAGSGSVTGLRMEYGAGTLAGYFYGDANGLYMLNSAGSNALLNPIGTNNLRIYGEILSTDLTQPWLSLDSTSSGDNWTAQGAGISVGESGKKGSAAIHMTYNGDGSGYLGMGVVDDTAATGGRPTYGHFDFDYNTRNIRVGGLLYPGNSAGTTGSSLVQSVAYMESADSQNYGSINCTGAAGSSGTYSGWSVNRRAVFMNNNGTTTGIYNDTNNHWFIRFIENGNAYIYHANSIYLQTQTRTGTGNTSGVQIQDHDGTMRDAGFNHVKEIAMTTGSITLSDQHCGAIIRRTGSSVVTLTVPAGSDFPVGSMCTVLNHGTGGSLTISDGSEAMYIMNGGGSVADSLGFTLPIGGVITIWRQGLSAYYVWGAGTP